MGERLVGVVTTIRPPTASVQRLASRLAREGCETVVVGDEGGPDAYDVPGTRLLSLADQRRSSFALARALPSRHYARKNLGYLQAMADGATCIYETDDDNHPAASWAPRPRVASAVPTSRAGWCNVYGAFTAELIWPRGFPLDRVRGAGCPISGPPRPVEAPIQQGLADVCPDVDAIWRLLLDRPFRFAPGPSVVLEPGAWCPFNSQSTWWRPPAFALMYLPSGCSFRMTDVWRSLVAQRCLWALGHGVVFHAPEVEQDRNAHDLMIDFEQELPGHRDNGRIADLLDALPLEPGAERVADNLLRCWEALVSARLVPAGELPLVEAWSADVAALAGRRGEARGHRVG